MTPGARMAAAIAILDAYFAGAPAERELTNWGRRSRFAGSGDRAAVRDMVFDAIRCQRSFSWLAQGTEEDVDGRALMLGWLRAHDVAPEQYFGAGLYAPEALSDRESQGPQNSGAMPDAVRRNLPDWLNPLFEHCLLYTSPSPRDS